MRVLVTGSSGQLGREIARQLAAAAHEVVGLDLVAGARTSVLGSVTDRALVRRLIADVEVVVHTAALHAPHVAVAAEGDFEAVNVEGTRHLLEAAEANGHARFVFTSTTSVYGDAMTAPDRAVWVTEELEPIPRDVYDRTKLAAEALCHDFARDDRLAAFCLRVSRAFPEEAAVVAGHRLHRGVDPRDAAVAHVLALTAPRQGCTIVNVSARPVFSPDDAVALRRDAPAPIERRCPGLTRAFAAHGWRLPETIDRVYAIDRAARVLGYEPRHGVASLLALPARWLYHLCEAAPSELLHAPPSLALEGFVHCSYQPEVAESARLHFPAGATLQVLQLDPRRLGVAVEDADTPRGPMPHVHGPIRRDAIVAVHALAEIAAAPDAF